MNEKILIVDDERDIREALSYVLESEGFNCATAENGEVAAEELEKSNYDILITDIVMPKMDGLKLLEKCLQISPGTIIILMTAYASVETAVTALRKGAVDYLLKPLEFDEVIVRLKQLIKHRHLTLENKLLRRQIDKRFNFNNIIGQSKAMQQVFAMIKQISSATTNVLITGPSGTGKELVARAIHGNSDRAEKPFIPVNCGAIPENLYESEFFGYRKGAFTGANTNYDGLFKSANQGTLFLDEIADLPEHVQVKLLRVLQEREVRPLGTSQSFKIDVRILSATNKDLLQEVQEERFREDLYYRLNVVEIKLPSLSERKEDIPLLINYFIERYNEELKRSIKGFDNDVIKALMGYEWKGNLRELENMVERAVLLCDSDQITVKQLPAYIQPVSDDPRDIPDALNDALQEYEKQHIIEVLNRTNWNRSEASKILGVDPSTLYRKMVKLDIKDRNE